ncbi:hypothetical protein INT44_005796 [Umbelopsis vinacea]|uniref:Uncharacterized protein n=1 Tax=Umbelopsis vinacea TaxID=44442 RepID=A0A8H7PZ51_9FUNG|nr:hypothetical protein INT44_005796 [Umbelopsis vinacea]
MIPTQEGFLIGSRVKRTTSTVNDSSDETVEHFVRGYQLLSRAHDRPYNAYGQFDEDLLFPQIENLDRSHIVGYFRFRRQTLQIPSQRERAMMLSLMKLLPTCTLFTLFTSSLVSEIGETHCYSCSMWQANDMDDHCNMTKVSTEIVNMMENTLRYKEFISNSGSTVEPSPLELKMAQAIDTKLIVKQYDDVYKEAEATKNLLASEKRLASLRREVELSNEEDDESSDLMDSVVFTPTLQSPPVSEGRQQSGDMIDLLS